MTFRHEWKHEITISDFIAVTQRLGAAAKPDIHAKAGNYKIRSLYFDNLEDQALREKMNGVSIREKFRLRYYNRDASYIRLEKKSKYNGLCSKEVVRLSEEETVKLLSGDYSWMTDTGKNLVCELYSKMMSQGLRPKTIVEYDRKAYTYAPGNVRVTLDYNIRTGLSEEGFLRPECILIPAKDAPIILEVKWDAFLPDTIRDAVQLEGRFSSPFSKYAACRIYG